MEILSKNLETTKKVAEEFVAKLTSSFARASADEGATVVGLYGNLGSGKTTFVQCVARALGITHHLTSPTFVIMKSYSVPTSTLNALRFTLLYHIDAYRLKSGAELEKLRFRELLQDPTNLVLIEWADLVSDILPTNHKKLFFEFIDDETRKITYS